MAAKVVGWFDDALAEVAEGTFGVGFFALARAGQRGQDGGVTVDEGPVGSVDAVLAICWCGNLGDGNAGGRQGFADGSVLGDGAGDVGLLVLMRIRVEFLHTEMLGAGHEDGAVNDRGDSGGC